MQTVFRCTLLVPKLFKRKMANYFKNVCYKLDVFVRPTWKDLIVHAGQFKDMYSQVSQNNLAFSKHILLLLLRQKFGNFQFVWVIFTQTIKLGIRREEDAQWGFNCVIPQVYSISISKSKTRLSCIISLLRVFFQGPMPTPIIFYTSFCAGRTPNLLHPERNCLSLSSQEANQVP